MVDGGAGNSGGVGLEVTLEDFEKIIGAVLTDDAQLDAAADS